MDNLHVLLVHFPIALLTAYGIADLLADLPSGRLRRLSFWFPLKAFLVMAGTLSGYATAVAGFYADESFAVGASERWVEMHTLSGLFTLLVATIISLLYGAAIRRRMRPDADGGLLGNLAVVAESRAMFAAGVIVLLAVLFTGTLGGIIAFGPDNDLFTRATYRWLK